MRVETNIDTVFKRFHSEVQEMPQHARRAIQISLFKAGTEVRTKAIGLAPAKSGDLRRSISMKPQSLSAIIDQVTVGTNKPYARIQDLGGTIRSKKKYLTIPIGNTKGRIQDHGDGFFIRTKAGKLLYVRKQGKGNIKPLFVLKRQVTIKGKPYLSKAFNDVTKSGKIARTLESEFEKQFKNS